MEELKLPLLHPGEHPVWIVVTYFLLLGIERVLYGFMYLFPQEFKHACKTGRFGTAIQNEPLLWKCAMTLGKFIKIFQFSVILYDLLVRNAMVNPMSVFQQENNNLVVFKVTFGLVLIFIGQLLNAAVFRALGGIGVYYGYEFGYHVKRTNAFPYNLGISDPQYWGVVMCVWGLYLSTQASSYLVPVLETFWYLVSMNILEHPNGKVLLGLKKK